MVKKLIIIYTNLYSLSILKVANESFKVQFLPFQGKLTQDRPGLSDFRQHLVLSKSKTAFISMDILQTYQKFKYYINIKQIKS